VWLWVQAVDARCLRFLLDDPEVRREEVITGYREQFAFGASQRVKSSVLDQLSFLEEVLQGRTREVEGQMRDLAAASASSAAGASGGTSGSSSSGTGKRGSVAAAAQDAAAVLRVRTWLASVMDKVRDLRRPLERHMVELTTAASSAALLAQVQAAAAAAAAQAATQAQAAATAAAGSARGGGVPPLGTPSPGMKPLPLPAVGAAAEAATRASSSRRESVASSRTAASNSSLVSGTASEDPEGGGGGGAGEAGRGDDATSRSRSARDSAAAGGYSARTTDSAGPSSARRASATASGLAGGSGGAEDAARAHRHRHHHKHHHHKHRRHSATTTPAVGSPASEVPRADTGSVHTGSPGVGSPFLAIPSPAPRNHSAPTGPAGQAHAHGHAGSYPATGATPSGVAAAGGAAGGVNPRAGVQRTYSATSAGGALSVGGYDGDVSASEAGTPGSRMPYSHHRQPSEQSVQSATSVSLPSPATAPAGMSTRAGGSSSAAGIGRETRPRLQDSALAGGSGPSAVAGSSAAAEALSQAILSPAAARQYKENPFARRASRPFESQRRRSADLGGGPPQPSPLRHELSGQALTEPDAAGTARMRSGLSSVVVGDVGAAAPTPGTAQTSASTYARNPSFPSATTSLRSGPSEGALSTPSSAVTAPTAVRFDASTPVPPPSLGSQTGARSASATLDPTASPASGYPGSGTHYRGPGTSGSTEGFGSPSADVPGLPLSAHAAGGSRARDATASGGAGVGRSTSRGSGAGAGPPSDKTNPFARSTPAGERFKSRHTPAAGSTSGRQTSLQREGASEPEDAGTRSRTEPSQPTSRLERQQGAAGGSIPPLVAAPAALGASPSQDAIGLLHTGRPVAGSSVPAPAARERTAPGLLETARPGDEATVVSAREEPTVHAALPVPPAAATLAAPAARATAVQGAPLSALSPSVTSSVVRLPPIPEAAQRGSSSGSSSAAESGPPSANGGGDGGNGSASFGSSTSSSAGGSSRRFHVPPALVIHNSHTKAFSASSTMPVAGKTSQRVLVGEGGHLGATALTPPPAGAGAAAVGVRDSSQGSSTSGSVASGSGGASARMDLSATSKSEGMLPAIGGMLTSSKSASLLCARGGGSPPGPALSSGSARLPHVLPHQIAGAVMAADGQRVHAGATTTTGASKLLPSHAGKTGSSETTTIEPRESALLAALLPSPHGHLLSSSASAPTEGTITATPEGGHAGTRLASSTRSTLSQVSTGKQEALLAPFAAAAVGTTEPRVTAHKPADGRSSEDVTTARASGSGGGLDQALVSGVSEHMLDLATPSGVNMTTLGTPDLRFASSRIVDRTAAASAVGSGAGGSKAPATAAVDARESAKSTSSTGSDVVAQLFRNDAEAATGIPLPHTGIAGGDAAASAIRRLSAGNVTATSASGPAPLHPPQAGRGAPGAGSGAAQASAHRSLSSHVGQAMDGTEAAILTGASTGAPVFRRASASRSQHQSHVGTTSLSPGHYASTTGHSSSSNSSSGSTGPSGSSLYLPQPPPARIPAAAASGVVAETVQSHSARSATSAGPAVGLQEPALHVPAAATPSAGVAIPAPAVGSELAAGSTTSEGAGAGAGGAAVLPQTSRPRKKFWFSSSRKGSDPTSVSHTQSERLSRPLPGEGPSPDVVDGGASPGPKPNKGCCVQ